MKKFFYSHPDTIIATLTLIFIGILLAFYSWASNDIYIEIHQALTFSPAVTSDNFNLTGAAKLDLRGLLIGSSTTSTTNTTVIPVIAPTATTIVATSSVTTATATTPVPAPPRIRTPK